MAVRNARTYVRASNGGESIFRPKPFNNPQATRTDGDQFRVLPDKMFIIGLQPQLLPAAVRSGKPPDKDEDNILVAEIRQADYFFLHVSQYELWGDVPY